MYLEDLHNKYFETNDTFSPTTKMMFDLKVIV